MSEAPRDRYEAALRAYLARGGEESLERAYEMGRQAMADGRGVLEIAEIYHSSLCDAVNGIDAEQAARIRTASAFFAETLSPFEMALRGFQDAYASLHALNESLARRAVELERTVTEQRRAEQQIRQLNAELERRAIALEATNSELESFSYSVSHDLHAPLRSIDGFSQALLEDYADCLDDEGKVFLQRVRAASQRMAQLIDDLLELSRLTRAEMRRESVDLTAVVQTVIDGLRQGDPSRVVECQVAEKITVDGDVRLLRIALENLLGNAWKFTGKRPHARIEFGALPETAPAVYYVRDNGAGFDPSYAGKLFGAFQRLHSAAEFPGTGIGLATVQRIVRRHGGRVWAESAVGEGATFYFTLAP